MIPESAEALSRVGCTATLLAIAMPEIQHED